MNTTPFPLGGYPYLTASETRDAEGNRWSSYSGRGSQEVVFGLCRKVAPSHLPQLRQVATKATDLHLEIILRTAPKQDVIRVTATGPLVADDVDALHGLETAIRNDLHRQVRRKR